MSHEIWLENLTPAQQSVYNKLKLGKIPKNTQGIFEKSCLSAPLFGYLPWKDKDKEIIGKRLKVNKIKRLSLSPLSSAILVYIPVNTEGITTSQYIYLGKDITIYPLKVLDSGRYIASTKKRLSIGAKELLIPHDIEEFTIPKKVSGGQTITVEDLEHLKNSPEKEHRDLADKIVQPQDIVKQENIQDTAHSLHDLADAHKEFNLVSQSLNDIGKILYGDPHTERHFDPSKELPSRKDIRKRLKDIVSEHSGHVFGEDGYNSEGVHIDQYIDKWFPELYAQHKDKIHTSPFNDTFYAIDVVPHKQKEEYIYDIDKDTYDKRDSPATHKLVWSKMYSPDSKENMRKFVLGLSKDPFGSGKAIPLHSQKFYKKDLEDLPEGEKPSKEIPVALTNYIRNVILADRSVGKKITHILINKDLSSRHQAFLRDANGHWHTIRSTDNTANLGENEKRNIGEVKRLKDLSTPIEHEGVTKSKYSHLLDHTYSTFLDNVEKVDAAARKYQEAREKRSPDLTKIKDEYIKLARERNILGSKIVRMVTGIRPGYNYHSTEGGIDLVGSRTLRPKHIRHGGDRVTVDFFGKTSKRHLQDYDNPMLVDMFGHTIRQNKQFAKNLFRSKMKRKKVLNSKHFFDSLPLFFGVNNDPTEKKFVEEKLQPFMEKIGLHPDTIKGMKDYDDRKMIFNIMTSQTAKELTKKYAQNPLHPLDISDIIHKTLALTSTRTGNRYETLKNSYILPGLLRKVIEKHHRELNNG